MSQELSSLKALMTADHGVVYRGLHSCYACYSRKLYMLVKCSDYSGEGDMLNS